MRTVGSLAFGFLITFVSLRLSESLAFAHYLLTPGFLFTDSLGFLGMHCITANSVSEKSTCAWLGLVANVVIYAAICFVVVTILKRNSRVRVAGP
jgi:hypothetical protein